ncbi:hypothetical protein [Sphingomonas aerolata]|uniref:hypothetical protein n=1 Tax=Sphingomonas aerolata TaxID=185951 RepID=UPI00208FAF68|nr:hypothetical protein [Sphingomonas aerolata]USR00116.1 hypothetical protein NEF64_17285 [Sphingomonas aerolata]
MKIKRLIKELDAIAKEHGNLPVHFRVAAIKSTTVEDVSPRRDGPVADPYVLLSGSKG